MRDLKLPPRKLQPMCVRRWKLIQLLCMIAIIAGFFLIVVTGYAATVAGLLIMVLAMIGHTLVKMRYKSLANHARRHDLRVCPRCTHPYDDENTDTCVACGKSFDALTSRRQWRAVVLRVQTKMTGPVPTKYKKTGSLPVVLVYTIIALVITGVGTSLASSMPGSGLGVLIFLLLLCAPAIWFSYRDGSGLKRLRELSVIAKSHDFLLCATCQYELDALPDAERCPECGTTIDRDDLRRRWYEIYGYDHVEPAAEMDVPLMTRKV